MPNYARLVVFCLLVLVIARDVSSQTPDIAFERLSLEHGLSQTSVYAITQDQQGFIWFGTQDGLNKYDGYTFTVYRNDPWDSTSLSNNYIRRLLVDRAGYIWVGTNGGGVNRLDPRTGKFMRYLHDPANPQSISHNEIWALYEDRQGTLWVGTGIGLCTLDTTTGGWKRYYSDPNNPASLGSNFIRAVYEDTNGVVWIGHGWGVTTFDQRSGVFTRIVQEFENYVWLHEDHRGTLWAGTGNEVYRLDPSGKQFQLVFQGGSESAVFSKTGIVWLGYDGSLARYDIITGTLSRYRNDPGRPESLSENTVLSLWEDRSGILWVGTFNGVNKYIPTKKRFTLVLHNPKDPSSISSDRIRAFSEDRFGAIWIATQEGLNRFDPTTNRFTRYNDRPGYLKTVNNTVFWSVLADNTTPVPTVWVGSNGGGVNKLVFPPGRRAETPLVRILPSLQGDTNSLSGNVIESMLMDRNGSLWFGLLVEGVTLYDPRRELYRQFRPDPDNPTSLKSGFVTVIYQTRDNTIWVGTFGGGIHKLNREQNAFTRYLHNPASTNSLSNNTVQSMYEDSSGFLWIGTYGGLNRLDRKTDTFTLYSTKDGLPNNVIYAILEDNSGNLWLSSNAGLTRFNPQTLLIRNYDVADGLQSNEFNHGAALKVSTGEMYFGGINGFNVFHPDSIRDNPNPPAVVLTDFRIFNKRLEPGANEARLPVAISSATELFLTHDDAVMTFEFAALEYTNSSRNQYAYMMDGFDPDWTPAGTKREATYTNLDPGTYTFRVKASNNDGVWNEAGTAITVHIAPPFWMSWWFRVLVALSVVSVVVVFVSRREAALKHEAELQKEFSRQLIQSQEQERWRIASELHDGLGQDLIVVKNRAFLGLKVPEMPPKATEQLQHILDTITIAISDMREIARNLRPYQLDTFGLSEALRTTLKRVGDASGIHFTVEVEDVAGLFSKETETNIFRVIQESANNIVKHSGATEAWFIIRRLPEKVTIEIRDNGKGFDMEHVTKTGKRGLGLSGISERVRIIGGSYQVTSQPGAGTASDMSIPIQLNSKKA